MKATDAIPIAMPLLVLAAAAFLAALPPAIRAVRPIPPDAPQRVEGLLVERMEEP